MSILESKTPPINSYARHLNQYLNHIKIEINFQAKVLQQFYLFLSAFVLGTLGHIVLQLYVILLSVCTLIRRKYDRHKEGKIL